jgi:nitroreductase
MLSSMASTFPDADSPHFDIPTVQAALEVAVRAPSIHNTQPWRWRLEEDGLVLLADRERQLSVADPDGHSLLISCGAALQLSELALRAAGWRLESSYLPDPADPDLLARIRPVARADADEQLQLEAEVEAARRRRCDRRPFAEGEVAAQDRERLRMVGSDSSTYVDFPDTPERHVELAVAVSWADRAERNDEAYLAEMSRWLRDPDVHTLADGVPVDAIPHVPVGVPRHTDIPLRDFEVGVGGRQLIEHDVDEHPLIAVVFTEDDRALDHLLAGMSMMRLMVQADLLGLSSCPLSQAVDFAAFRVRLQAQMGWIGCPQMILRFGLPTTPITDLPLAPRRPVAAVLDLAVNPPV